MKTKEIVQYPKLLDLSRYVPSCAQREVYYGLPENVKFCRRCVISNQRPNSTQEFRHKRDSKKTVIHIGADGICDACHAVDMKINTDWEARRRELEDLCDRYRRTDGRYDCLVPGSGGKDSFYQAHVLKYEFGMHPLTVTWAPHIYTDWGWKNHQAWVHSGFDNVLVTPNGRVHRLLTRLAVENLLHPFQPFILGQKGIAPKIAAMYDIPLVFYGENEAEYGNPVADMKGARRDWKYFTETDPHKIYLSGASIAQLKEDYGLEQLDLEPYMPVNPSVVEKKDIQVHYLGYYLKWHPQGAYYYAVEHGGFQASPERTAGTYSKYNSIDDKNDDLHYYTTFIKFGIGRATYDAAQEIRSGDITREEGIALVRKYDGEFPDRFADELFRYLSINEREFPKAAGMFEESIMNREYFDVLCDRFRSPHLWDFDNGRWRLRYTVWGGEIEQSHASAREWKGNPGERARTR